MKSKLLTFLKGLCVGGTMIVPGVSGGSMAMILGIYDKLVSSISSFMKHKRKSAAFLAIFSIGGLLGMILFAKPLLSLIHAFHHPVMYFFIGAVAGGIPLIFKKARTSGFGWRTIVYPVIGFALVLLLSLLPKDLFQTSPDAGAFYYLLLLLAGFVAAVALVLPGISVSYLLLLMGMYDQTMKAISELYFPFLLPLGIGLILGILLTTRVLENAMNRHPQPTYLIILGFILGSVVLIFPGIPAGWDIPICILTVLAGFFAIWFLSRAEGE